MRTSKLVESRHSTLATTFSSTARLILIDWPQVRARTGGPSRSSVWRWMRQGLFPLPVEGGIRRNAWRLSDIEDWVASRQTAAAYRNVAEAGRDDGQRTNRR